MMESGLRNISIKKTGTVILLLLYIIVGLAGPIHSLILHEKEALDCNDEENACHLLVVHHDIENGCDHETHIISSELTCDLCSLAAHSTAFISDIRQEETIHCSERNLWLYSEPSYVEDVIGVYLSRGPPNLLG